MILYQKMQKIINKVLKAQTVANDYYTFYQTQFNSEYPNNFIGLLKRLKRKTYKISVENLHISDENNNNLVDLSSKILEINYLLNMLLGKYFTGDKQKHFTEGKEILDKKSYDLILKRIDAIDKILTDLSIYCDSVLIDKKDQIKEINIKCDNISNCLCNFLLEIGSHRKKTLNSIEYEEGEEENILLDSSLYLSVKDFNDILELQEFCINRRYSYEIYLKLVKAYFVYQKEIKKISEKEEELIKNNDVDVIKSQANNDIILDLYSKEQLIKTSKILIDEIALRKERDENHDKDLNSLFGVVNYLMRHK